MENYFIAQLENQLFPCSCGKTHSVRTKKIIVGKGILARIPEVLTELNLGKKILLVFDENTYRAAGKYVEETLQGEHFETIACPLSPKPDWPYLEPDEEARSTIGSYLYYEPNLLMAIGSGVITDLTKFVAHRLSIPFVAVATAPSMDGYSSPGTPMLVGGYKVTYDATPPQVIFADLDVLTRAPLPLIHAGLADLVGKITSNADWAMRTMLWQESFCQPIWEDTKTRLMTLDQEAEKLPQRDEKSIFDLSLASLYSGMGMDMVGDSRPASGAEHLVAHYLEIMALHRGIHPSLHGLRVGGATVVVSKMYHRFLEEVNDLARRTWILLSHEKFETIKMHFGPLFPFAQEVVLKKQKLTPCPLEVLKTEQFREAIEDKLSSLPSPSRTLSRALAPQSLEELGFPPSLIREAFLYARFLRERLTLLDLLDALGVLEEYLDWALSE